MAKISIKLDERYNSKNGKNEFPIRIWIRNCNTSISILTGVAVRKELFLGDDPSHVVSQRVPNCKSVNENIYNLYLDIQRFIVELSAKVDIKDMPAKEILNRYKSYVLNNGEEEKKDSISSMTFTKYIKQVRDAQNKSSKHLFDYTIEKLHEFNNHELLFEDITYAFLKNFDTFMQRSGMSINTRGIIFRNIRTTINQAINNDLTENYPFRKFKIQRSQKDKEYLHELDFKKFLEYQPKNNGEQKAKDLFLLSFYFCGINPIDIYTMPKSANYIKFTRTKTSHKVENKIKIKIQPEAQEILKRYTSDDLLVNFSEHYNSYEIFYRFMGKQLKEIAKVIGVPELSMYWARYTWATYASKLQVESSIISRALGHAPTSLAEKVYISFDWDNVDLANRKVLDYVKTF